MTFVQEKNNTIMEQVKESSLSSLQHAVLIGSLLGDGYLERRTASLQKTCRLRFCHSRKQREYVEWKYKVFASFCGRTKAPYITKRNESVVNTSCCSVFYDYHNQWYRRQDNRWKKQIPANLESILVDPVALAVWYLDDGTKIKKYNTCRLATCCFSLEEHERLQACLEHNFRVKVKIEQRRGNGKSVLTLRIPSRGNNYHRWKSLLYDIVKTEIPSMLYKFE